MPAVSLRKVLYGGADFVTASKEIIRIPVMHVRDRKKGVLFFCRLLNTANQIRAEALPAVWFLHPQANDPGCCHAVDLGMDPGNQLAAGVRDLAAQLQKRAFYDIGVVIFSEFPIRKIGVLFASVSDLKAEAPFRGFAPLSPSVICMKE